jgi:transcriptional regulator with XRE-family HTH domain
MDILNEEFARLLKASGWKRAEAARQLALSSAVVTRYLNRDTHPSLTVLKLFKLLIGDVQPLPGEVASVHNHDGELEPPLDAAERQLIRRLRALEIMERRQVVQGFSAVLGALERKPVAVTVKPKARVRVRSRSRRKLVAPAAT